jgi:hypothetical protein
METPAQRCARLLVALEDLARREALCLDLHDFPAVAQLQRQSAPLVAALVEHGPAVVDDGLRARMAAWLAHRHETDLRLADQIARARDRLRELEASRRRVTRLAPAYSMAEASPARQLCAVG